MDTETITLREGDIYRWRYREPGDDRAYCRYHCCSNIAVVKSGRLCDTYWQIGDNFSDGKSFTADGLSKLDLVYVGNFSDLRKSHERDAIYYDDADIVNLNHANSSSNNFYLRKHAKRSAAKMLESAKRKLEQAESDARYAASRAEDARTSIARIEAGDISGFI